jgi:hypothetical protein
MVPDVYQSCLIAELNHQINSPLTAIRNALYLIACRTDDPEILRYLRPAPHPIRFGTRLIAAAACPSPRGVH